MKQPTLIDGLVVAALISMAAAVISLLFGGFIVYGLLFELLLYGGTLTYLLYLLKRSPAKIGRVVVIAGWSVISLAGWILDLGLLQQVLVQAGIIWLVRSLHFHDSLFTAALDFGLVSAGLAAGFWALLNTGSMIAATWTFFLVQALFCLLPTLAGNAGPAAATRQASGFDAAHRVAVDAVRKLSQP